MVKYIVTLRYADSRLITAELQHIYRMAVTEYLPELSDAYPVAEEI
jgi:hypothetical protein